MKKMIVIAMLLILCFSVKAQNDIPADEFHMGLFKTDKGARLIYTSDIKSMEMEFISDNIEPSENPDAMTIDYVPFHTELIPAQQNFNFDSLPTEKQKEGLTRFMNNEIVRLSKNLNQDFEPPVIEWMTLNNKLFLFWSIKSTDTKSEYEKQLFLTTVCFKQVLNLNTSVIRMGGNFENAKALLVKTLKTLKLNNFGIDLKKLYEELNK